MTDLCTGLEVILECLVFCILQLPDRAFGCQRLAVFCEGIIGELRSVLSCFAV